MHSRSPEFSASTGKQNMMPLLFSECNLSGHLSMENRIKPCLEKGPHEMSQLSVSAFYSNRQVLTQIQVIKEIRELHHLDILGEVLQWSEVRKDIPKHFTHPLISSIRN